MHACTMIDKNRKKQTNHPLSDVEQVGEIRQGTVIMLACGSGAPAERVVMVSV